MTPTDFNSLEMFPVSVAPHPATQHASPGWGPAVGKQAAATPDLTPMPIGSGVRKRHASKLRQS